MVTILEWSVYEVFLSTQLFTGPEQFVVQQLSCFIMDVYFMLYCPCMWIRRSIADRWAGWGQRARKTRGRKYFYFVRKPDPREDLIRQGYFRKRGQFAYMRNNDVVKSVMEQRLKHQKDHSVYVISEPESGQDIAMSTAYDWREDVEEWD